MAKTPAPVIAPEPNHGLKNSRQGVAVTPKPPAPTVVTESKSAQPAADGVDPVADRPLGTVLAAAASPAMTNPAMAVALSDHLQPEAAITQGVGSVLEPGQQTPAVPMVAATTQLVAAPLVNPDVKRPASEDLDAFLYRVQNAKMAEGIVVVEASHPDAIAGNHVGTYSGFPLGKGKRFARWSDGSTED